MGTIPESADALINELSELCGILSEYWDIFGKKHATSVGTKMAILRSMKLKVDSAEGVLDEINKRRWREWKRLIKPVHVISVNDQPFSLPVYLPSAEGKDHVILLSWSVTDEAGNKESFTISGRDFAAEEEHWIDGRRYIKAAIPDQKTREIGYYEIAVECTYENVLFNECGKPLTGRAKLIIAPDACYIPPELETGRTWGIAVNLYSISSARNWGIGDFTDLREIANLTAYLGGGYVGINPLHAIPNTKPFGTSPYSPVSRLYRNFIYLDIDDIPDVKESDDAMSIVQSAKFNREVEELREGEFIDYERVATLKEQALKPAFESFYEKHYRRNTGRAREFRRYLSENDYDLNMFASYMALSDFFGVQQWHNWPDEYHDPSGKEVGKFKKTHKKEMLFYKYIQWLIEGQLRKIAVLCKERRMPVGIYHDLAVGSAGGGSDIWSHQGLFAIADTGAPPDDFSPDGQNWGFPPMIPEKLEDAGYELFVKTVRSNMKYGGVLRIDHAFGLFRLFWIPSGMSPRDGAYVLYPSEDLIRIIALESMRNKVVIIAEDLGTSGENVRETLRKFNMLSYRLLYFERNYPDPGFLPPEKYPEMALCAVTTHDLPTIYGYWEGRDITIRRELGKYPDEDMWRRQSKERERDKLLLIKALKSQDILPCGSPEHEQFRHMTPDICAAIYRYLAKTPCKMVLVSLDDVIGALDQQNMPGTIDSHPNWIRKTALLLEDIDGDKRFSALAEMFRNNMAAAQRNQQPSH